MADPHTHSSLQGPFVLKEKVRLRSTIKESSESQNPNLEPQAKGTAESKVSLFQPGCREMQPSTFTVTRWEHPRVSPSLESKKCFPKVSHCSPPLLTLEAPRRNSQVPTHPTNPTRAEMPQIFRPREGLPHRQPPHWTEKGSHCK